MMDNNTQIIAIMVIIFQNSWPCFLVVMIVESYWLPESSQSSLYYQLSQFDITKADLTEFFKREKEARLWEKEEYLSCFLLGWALKHLYRSLLQPALDFLPPHALSALPSVRKYIGSFPPDGVCVGPEPWNAACFHGVYMEPSQETSKLGRGQMPA